MREVVANSSALETVTIDRCDIHKHIYGIKDNPNKYLLIPAFSPIVKIVHRLYIIDSIDDTQSLARDPTSSCGTNDILQLHVNLHHEVLQFDQAKEAFLWLCKK